MKTYPRDYLKYIVKVFQFKKISLFVYGSFVLVQNFQLTNVYVLLIREPQSFGDNCHIM